jgi:MtN3 and saliva related transmembrane protein
LSRNKGLGEEAMGEAGVAVLGAAATALSTVSLVPQVWRSLRTRSARDIALGWLAAAIAGSLLWIGYGLLAPTAAVVWANALTLVQFLLILGVKLATERRGAA